MLGLLVGGDSAQAEGQSSALLAIRGDQICAQCPQGETIRSTASDAEMGELSRRIALERVRRRKNAFAVSKFQRRKAALDRTELLRIRSCSQEEPESPSSYSSVGLLFRVDEELEPLPRLPSGE